jgi:hypothetical protein
MLRRYLSGVVRRKPLGYGLMEASGFRQKSLDILLAM